jgi:hypothetical protein
MHGNEELVNDNNTWQRGQQHPTMRSQRAIAKHGNNKQ